MDKRADDAADDAADGRWMTYAELGQARGISKESALKLALRRKWRKQDDNRGHVRVYVPIEWAERRDIGAASGADARADLSRAINAFGDTIATLREQLERERAQAEAAARRADQADARTAAAEVGRAAERARSVVEHDRAEAAERRADALQVQLDQTLAESRDAAQRAERLQRTEEARRNAGLLTRLRAAWRGE
jgi:hypothetical protein